MSSEPSASAAADDAGGQTPPPSGPAGRNVARNTAIFSVATGLSRVAGLAREIVASSYFATSGPFSAFTLAFQLPNLVRSLFADAALGAAFVPVFTELLEQGRRRDAFRLASTLLMVMLTALGAITVLFIVGAGLLVPMFTGDKFDASLDALTVGLTRVMFPVVLILGVNGLAVGMLNAFDHFTIPALSPLVWNLVILAFLVAGHTVLDGDEELYAYAVGIVAGTGVQLAMAIGPLRRLGVRLDLGMSWRDERVRHVLALMLPITIGLGLINFNLLINSTLGTFLSKEAARAIDAAFRIYMLPQGLFSVAIATVLFPALSRLAARRDFDGLRALTANGMRQILLMLIPAAAGTLALATPITRLIYEHGAFGPDSTELVSSALLWFSLSLPFSGVNLLLTRSFFSLQRPWVTTVIAALNLAVNAIVAIALYRPLGIPGIVLGTAVGSAAMTAAQIHFLRRALGGRLDGRRTTIAAVQMTAAAAVLAAGAYGVWLGLDAALGRSLVGELIAVGAGLCVGTALYACVVLALGIPEASQIRRLVAGRLRRRDER